MPLPTNFVPTQLTLTYNQPVNGSPNANVATVNVNLVAYGVNVVMYGANVNTIDVTGLIQSIMARGYWNGLTFIPGQQITLITAS